MKKSKAELAALKAAIPKRQPLPVLSFILEPGDPEPVLPPEYLNYDGPEVVVVISRIIDGGAPQAKNT